MSWWRWWAWGGLALVGIAVCAGVIAFAVREPFRQGWNSVQNVDMPPVETESAATRQQALRAAFDSQQRAPDDALLQEIEALLEQVIAATRDHHNSSFRGLVNVERYFLEVKKTGLIRELRGWIGSTMPRGWLGTRRTRRQI